MSDELKPCRNCGSENMHHFSKSDTVECNVCAESSRTAEWQADTAREKALRADLAAWQAHSAGLMVMNKALEELVEAHEEVDYALEVALELIALCGNAGLPANMGEHESGNRRRTNAARDKVQAARAKVEELRGATAAPGEGE